MPALTPAPASQATDVPPLWSRPVAPWVNGWRPNSVLQTTSVSSSSPRALQVAEQSGDRPVNGAGDRGQFARDVGVVVPVVLGPARAAPDLDEPHAALEQPAGQEAAAAEVGGRRVVQSIHALRRGCLACEVECFGSRLLHAGGQLVGVDARLQPRVSRVGGGVTAVQSLAEPPGRRARFPW